MVREDQYQHKCVLQGMWDALLICKIHPEIMTALKCQQERKKSVCVRV
jgi:hypothetical protein